MSVTVHPATSVVAPYRGKLNICLLGYRSNPYSGGQGIYIKFLSKALVDAGHSVDVISGPPYPDLDQRVRLIKLPSLNLYEAENHVTALRLKHLLSYTDFIEWFSMLTGGFSEPYTFGRRLVRYFKRHKPNYDIVHDNQSLCYGTLELQKMGIPLVTTIHHPITNDMDIALQNADSWQLRWLIKRWHSFLKMQKKVVGQLRHLVTVSNASRSDIARAFDISVDQLVVVHNGIDTNVFKPIREIDREQTMIMVTASADVPLKGLQYLLLAIHELIQTIPDIRLTVLGKIQADGKTATLINDLDLRDHITFHSDLSTDEVVALYAKATIAVVPSIYEGFGLPAGEAMACGVPTISTDGGALPEVVGDCGIIVPVRDSSAIAKAINELLCNKAMRDELAIRGRRRIVEKFSWNVAATSMVDLYREIMQVVPASIKKAI